MKSILMVFVLFVSLAFMPKGEQATGSDTNENGKRKPVILNAGFEEEGETGFRDNWLNKSLGGPIQITNGPIFEGVKAGKLPDEGDRIAYQLVRVEPNTDYAISFYYLLRSEPAGSLTVSILNGDVQSKAQVEGGTISTLKLSNEDYDKRYRPASIQFNSGDNDAIGLFLTNEGVDARFDSFKIEETVE
ncbi:hypothetical protein [Marinoscillum sp. MHG1-6]|uniref:hypothetical protein n=1 Tax=Marinoscillum sp. MHG1-6 TaxID=2959627 RepID=UPI0021575025|nr:hypothetical protein [Marinoscillum sp. MHG1-6]